METAEGSLPELGISGNADPSVINGSNQLGFGLITLATCIPGDTKVSSQVPYDYAQIMGDQLPKNLYYLVLQGIISHKLPQAIAKGEWLDKSLPLVEQCRLVYVSLRVGRGLRKPHSRPSSSRGR